MPTYNFLSNRNPLHIVSSPLKRKNGKGVAQSDLEKAEEFNGQFTDVYSIKMNTTRSRFSIGLHLS